MKCYNNKIEVSHPSQSRSVTSDSGANVRLLEHDSLRLARGSGGVHDQTNVVLVQVGRSEVGVA